MQLLTDNATINQVLKFGVLTLGTMLLCQCSSQPKHVDSDGNYLANHGPFDEEGNYVENWADNPPSKRPKTKPSNKLPEPEPTPEPMVLASNQVQQPRLARQFAPTPQPTRSYSKPKTVNKPKTTYKPKPKTVSKPKPKPKPKPRTITPKVKPAVYHTVKKGDTLYAISRKYGCSVSTIQKSNGISGSTIRIGQRIKIPR